MNNNQLVSNIRRSSNLGNLNLEYFNNPNNGRSEVVVGVGKHKDDPKTRCFAGPSNKPYNHDKITLDLNNLQNESVGHQGCNLEVYVLVKHVPGCKHKRRNEISMGSRAYDFVGKAVIPYRPNDCSNNECSCGNNLEKKVSRERMSSMSSSNNGGGSGGGWTKFLHEGTMRKQMKSRRYRQCPFYMIDEYSMVDTRYEDRPVSKLYQQKKINFSQSEIDLYELDFIGNY